MNLETKSVVFSVGLNVGSDEPREQLGRTLAALRSWRIEDLALGVGEWEGVRERFLQFRIECLFPADTAAFLAKHLNQKCVAVLSGKHWKLVDASGKVVDGGSVSEYPVIISTMEQS